MVQNLIILKFLINGGISVNWVLLNVLPNNYDLIYSKAKFGSFKISLKIPKNHGLYIVRAFCENSAILKFLIQGSVSVHWVLLNISPKKHGL